MRPVYGHRYDRHAQRQGQLDEAGSPAELDGVAFPPGTEHLVVAARKHHHRGATLERQARGGRTRRQRTQLAQQRPDDRIGKEEIIGQHVQRRGGAALLDPASKQRGHVARLGAARVIADEEDAAVLRHAFPAADLCAEVAVDGLDERQQLFHEDWISLKRIAADLRLQRRIDGIDEWPHHGCESSRFGGCGRRCHDHTDPGVPSCDASCR